ncbi:MAG: helix-hairpin-helix domain-containing protein [Polyangiales bacterium]
MVNGHIALAFDELATLLELSGESAFKTRAYRAFAETVRGLDRPIATIAERGELASMRGVGKAIAAKVGELLTTGRMGALDRARESVPQGLPDLLRIGGLGPARVHKLWKALEVTSIEQLVAACRDGRVAKLSGFGNKMVAKLLVDAEAALSNSGSVLLAEALAISSLLMTHIVERFGTRVRAAGQARRGHELVDEITIVVADVTTAELTDLLLDPNLPVPINVGEINTSAEDVVVAARAHNHPPRLRFRCVSSDNFVHALLVETGSAEHVVALEALAATRGTTLRNLCRGLAEEELAYAALGLNAMPPELREGGRFVDSPHLLGVRGVRGIFHVHTTWSDGVASIADMARAAAHAGFDYVGISDHSRAANYANGLDVDRVLAQRAEIETARRAVPQIRILHGIEVDVLTDGTLDLPDDLLVQLDFVVASLHTGFQLDHEAQTLRMIRAVSHPLVTILGHPTGRLLLGREGYHFDVERVAQAAAEFGVFLEINASPSRLDLSPPLIRRAAAVGANFCINPDAHEPRGFGDVPLGVSQARRAGLRATQVFNALDCEAVVDALRARRSRGAEKLGLQAS